MSLSKSCGRQAHELQRTWRSVDRARGCVSRGGARESGAFVDGLLKKEKKNHDQHEFVVLLRGDGSGRLSAAKFLHLLPVVAAERGELAPQTRQ